MKKTITLFIVLCLVFTVKLLCLLANMVLKWMILHEQQRNKPNSRISVIALTLSSEAIIHNQMFTSTSYKFIRLQFSPNL